MSLLDLFKPKWKHSNPDVRKEALQNIFDQEILSEIALKDRNISVRETALERINNNQMLINIIKKTNQDRFGFFIRKVIEKLTDNSLLYDYINDKNTYTYLKRIAIQRLTSKDLLSELLEKDDNVIKTEAYDVLDNLIYPEKKEDENRKIKAELLTIKKESNPQYLLDHAKKSYFSIVRETAIEKISDQGILLGIAKDVNLNIDIRKSAIKKIDDLVFVSEIIEKFGGNDRKILCESFLINKDPAMIKKFLSVTNKEFTNLIANIIGIIGDFENPTEGHAGILMSYLNYKNSENITMQKEIQSKAKDGLLHIAMCYPEILISNWKEIHLVLTENHQDSYDRSKHEDASYSDCGHTDKGKVTHKDIGFGVDRAYFPKKLPRL